MKDQILKLRSEGKTYKQIREELGIKGNGLITYYCGGDEQREKHRIRTAKWRKKKPPEYFQIKNFTKKKRKNSVKSVRKFQLKEKTFTWEDVVSKFGIHTECYLTGDIIDLEKNEFNLDHIIPISKNGNNTIDNLGITTPQANRVKSDLLVEELVETCIKILSKRGYLVTNKNENVV